MHLREFDINLLQKWNPQTISSKKKYVSLFILDYIQLSLQFLENTNGLRNDIIHIHIVCTIACKTTKKSQILKDYCCVQKYTNGSEKAINHKKIKQSLVVLYNKEIYNIIIQHKRKLTGTLVRGGFATFFPKES